MHAAMKRGRLPSSDTVPSADPAKEQRRRDCARQLRGDEAGDSRWLDAAEGVGQSASDGDRRIGEARARREPVRRGDVAGDGDRHDRGAPACAVDDDEQSERGDEFAEKLRRTGACVMREDEERMLEHRMRRGDAGNRARELRHDISGHPPPRKRALDRGGDGDGGIEMRAGDRREGEDQRDQDRAGGDAVRQERDRHVPARQPLPHDARADDGGDEQRRADRFTDDGPHAAADYRVGAGLRKLL